MDIFDSIIKETCADVEKWDPKRWEYKSDKCWKTTSTNEIVFLRDAAYELGGSGLPAVSFSCVTTSADIVDKDEILLVGDDLGQIRADVPFARIVFLSLFDISGDEDEAYKTINALEFLKYRIYPENYMMRIAAVSRREQVRVGKKAVAAGISFEKIGNLFIKKFKDDPRVKNVKIMFITREIEEFVHLLKNAQLTENVTKALCHVMEGMSFDCATCGLKPVCDEVEGLRKLHFNRSDGRF